MPERIWSSATICYIYTCTT